MRIKRGSSEIVEGDLTPMIDMTFQLIAFFMVMVNFSDTEAAQDVTLPESALVVPPDETLENVIYVHITQSADVIFNGERLIMEELSDEMKRELRRRDEEDDVKPDDITLIVRGDHNAQAGDVQKVVQECVDLGVLNINIRATQIE